MDMDYNRPFHGPLSRKIERVMKYLRGPQMDAFALRTIDVLDGFIRENLPPGIYDNYSKNLLPCARTDIREGKYKWALDDISTMERLAHDAAGEKLRDVGDGCFRLYLSPLQLPGPPEIPRDEGAGNTKSAPKKYIVAGIELDPGLKEDEIIELPPVSGGIQ